MAQRFTVLKLNKTRDQIGPVFANLDAAIEYAIEHILKAGDHVNVGVLREGHPRLGDVMAWMWDDDARFFRDNPDAPLSA